MPVAVELVQVSSDSDHPGPVAPDSISLDGGGQTLGRGGPPFTETISDPSVSTGHVPPLAPIRARFPSTGSSCRTTKEHRLSPSPHLERNAPLDRPPSECNGAAN